jgi:hypothetical protein
MPIQRNLRSSLTLALYVRSLLEVSTDIGGPKIASMVVLPEHQYLWLGTHTRLAVELRGRDGTLLQDYSRLHLEGAASQQLGKLSSWLSKLVIAANLSGKLVTQLGNFVKNENLWHAFTPKADAYPPRFE